MSPAASTSSIIPRIEDYDIDPISGFLPREPPLRRLADPYYAPWEELMDDFNSLLLAGRLRAHIHHIPVLEVGRLISTGELRRAFLVLSMLAHGYVWGKNEPVAQSLPASISVPWCHISEILGVRPVSCHAAMALWNWKLLDPEAPRDLSNFGILYTFSGATDEAWFYLITTAMEARGGPAVLAILDAVHETNSPTPNADKLAHALNTLASVITEMADIFQRMYESCDPYIFFWRVRPHLAGWTNMASAGLPNGLHYAGVDPPGTFRQYSGGSAGQSALMHLFDVALGVMHHKTGTPGKGRNNFLRGMRDYMPRQHSDFLSHLEKVCNIRTYCETRGSAPVVAAFDAAVNAMKLFRDRHVQMVTLYIVLPARKQPAAGGRGPICATERPSSPAISGDLESKGATMATNGTVVTPDIKVDEERAELGGCCAQATVDKLSATLGAVTISPQVTACPVTKLAGASKVASQSVIGGLARTVNANEILRGTGGSDLIPFLRQCRDETTATQIKK